MRRGEVQINGGYDGAYGEIRLFTPAERTTLLDQVVFSVMPRRPLEARGEGGNTVSPSSVAQASRL